MSQETLVSVFQKKKSARDLFNPAITPENIPQFTIPSLAILENSRIFPAKKSFVWRSHQWHQDEIILNQKYRRCSDPVRKNTHGLSSVRIVDLPDPVTRAAMSLPHLPKVSTPYGFLTLGESPHIARKESIFFKITSVGMESTENGLQNPLISEFPEKEPDCIHIIPETKNMSHVPQCTDNTGETSVGSSIQEKPSDSQKLLFRRSSIPVCNSRSYGQVNKREWTTPFLTQRSNSLPKITIRRSSQNLFQFVLKKHLNSLKSSSVELVENVET